MQQGVSCENILDTIRNSVGDQTLQKHLIGDQDIKNIKKSFTIDTLQRHQNDQDMNDQNDRFFLDWRIEWRWILQCIVFQVASQPDSENWFEKDDFLLIIQKHLIRQFGSKGICCDTTHGTTGCNFKLTSFLISDEWDENITVAHCISHKETFHIMEIFFKEVKSSCRFIARRWCMKDTGSQFYDAFALVNDVSPIQLLCTWHMDKAWHEELRQKVSSIKI